MTPPPRAERTTSITGSRALAVALVVTLVAGAGGEGCAVRHPQGFQTAIAAGDRAYTAGRMAEAGAAFDRAAEATTLARDQDEAVYLAAGAYLRAGDLPDALSRYDHIAVAVPPGERAARAALESARIRRSALETSRADTDLEALVRRFPDTGPGRRALDLLLEDIDTADPTLRRSMALLDALARALPGARLLDALLMERARRMERGGDPTGALAGYRRLLDTVAYPFNRHWDDGGLALTQGLRGAGDYRGAVAVADRVLAVRESSYGNGDYEAPRFGELAMLRGRILRDDLRQLPAAAAAFHFVYASFVSSRLRDDALWEEAATRTTAGDLPGACVVYATLAREFGCTHLGRAAAARLTACGQTSPPTSPHACEDGGGRGRLRRTEGAGQSQGYRSAPRVPVSPR